MNALDYNRREYDEGRLTDHDIVYLVTQWQESVGLEPDGKFGPKSQARMNAALTGANPSSSPLGLAALQVAIANIGHGEEGGNNSGPFVEMLQGKQYDGDTDDDGAWCAAFIGWCFEKGAARLGTTLPFKRSAGAKKLWKNIGNAGSFPSVPAPGDVFCFDRGKKGSWQGHIGIVERYADGIMYTVEGNVGRYPSKVRRFMHDLADQSRLEGFARAPHLDLPT